MSMPQKYYPDRTGGLDTFVENRRQNIREVRLAQEKCHQSKMKSRSKANIKTARESAGTVAQTGDLIFVKGSDSNIDRNGRGGKLEHERWMGSWKIIKTFDAGVTIGIVLGRRNTRTRHVFPACIIKPSYARPPDIRHHLTTKLAHYTWPADFELFTPCVAAKPLDIFANADK